MPLLKNPNPSPARQAVTELKIEGTGILRYGIWQGNVNGILCASHAKFLFRNSLSGDKECSTGILVCATLFVPQMNGQVVWGKWGQYPTA